jgi:two-component system invasion response regulator UvrY
VLVSPVRGNEISTAERGLTGAGAEPGEGSARRPPIRVLVAAEHPAFGWGLMALLEEQSDLDVAALATTADDAVAQARHEAVDVAVLDYDLCGHNGLLVTRKLKALARPPQVVLFSKFASAHLAASCALAGADALLAKDTLGADVCYAIRAVSRGRRLIQAPLTA